MFTNLSITSSWLLSIRPLETGKTSNRSGENFDPVLFGKIDYGVDISGKHLPNNLSRVTKYNGLFSSSAYYSKAKFLAHKRISPVAEMKGSLDVVYVPYKEAKISEDNLQIS